MKKRTSSFNKGRLNNIEERDNKVLLDCFGGTTFKESIEEMISCIVQNPLNHSTYPWLLKIEVDADLDYSDIILFREELKLQEDIEVILDCFFNKNQKMKKVASFYDKGCKTYHWRVDSMQFDYRDTLGYLKAIIGARRIKFEITEDKSWDKTLDILGSLAPKTIDPVLHSLNFLKRPISKTPTVDRLINNYLFHLEYLN